MINSTTITKKSLSKLRAAGLTFGNIVAALKARGHITSISHLSRIANDERQSSDDLARAMQALAHA